MNLHGQSQASVKAKRDTPQTDVKEPRSGGRAGYSVGPSSGRFGSATSISFLHCLSHSEHRLVL